MTITRTDRNQRFADGVLVSEDVVQTDITAETVRADIVTKARNALAANQAFINRYNGGASPTQAQVVTYMQTAARELSAIIRLLGCVLPELDDLLVENIDT